MMYNIRMYNDYAESTGLFVDVPFSIEGGTLTLRLIPEANGNTLDIESEGQNVLFSIHPGEEDISIHIEGEFTYKNEKEVYDKIKVYNTPYGFRWELGIGGRLPIEGELRDDATDDETFPSVEFNIVNNE